MKVLLAYPPFAWPSAPPLGISLLNSYLQTADPDAGIECMDLNLEFFSRPAPLVRPLCRMCARRGRGGCIPPSAFLAGGLFDGAASFFRSGGSAFYNPKQHAQNYIFVRSFMEQARACHESILKSYIEGTLADEGPVEKLVARLGEKILRSTPDIVGFSANSDQAPWSLALAKWLKRNSGITTVIGGFFPSFCGAENIVRAFPFIDYAAKGEGEKTLASLVAKLTRNTSGKTPGLAYIRRGRLYSSECEPERDLDALPFPDFSDYRIADYFSPAPVLPVLASRGCPWGRCAFCAHAENYGKIFRRRSAENVALEISNHKKTIGAARFLFCDEHIDGKRLEELSAAVKPFGVSFGLAGLKPGKNVTASRLETARRAGCRWVYIGAESLSPRILKLMRKGTSAKEVIRVIHACGRAGITPFVSYIWGFPTQTRGEVAEEAALIKAHSDFLHLPDDGHPFTLEKGSPVAEKPGKFGIARMEAVPMFETAAGHTVLSGKYRFAPGAGLTPLQAVAAYRPGPEIPYETHSFWESLILLSERGRKLVFGREEFFFHILLYPEKRMAAALDKIKNPGAEILLARGLCLVKLGKLKQAEKAFLTISKMKIAGSIKFAAFYQAGLIEKSAGDFKAAEKLFRAAKNFSARQEDKIAVMYHIAQCRERAGDPESAAEIYKELLENRSGGAFEVRALAALGAVLVRLKKFNEGIAVLEKASGADMEGAHALAITFQLAAAYEKTGDAAMTETFSERLKNLL